MFYIVDWSWFLFRAYYSIPKILDKNWNEAWAVFWFFRMILKLIHDRPDNFIVVFDPWWKTKRNEEFKEYKQNRPEIEDWFKKQIPVIIDILKKSSFYVELIKWYEADDVIYSLTKSIKINDNVVIVSSDKDLKQLIDDNVEFLDTKNFVKVNKQTFFDEYGFNPSSMLLYLSLLWDSSDNIPWVKWIWKKTALEIVRKYWSFNDLILNIDSFPNKIKKLILDNQELIHKNIALIKLKDPKEFNFKYLKDSSLIKQIDFDKLKNILVNEYWFKSFDWLITKLKKDINSPMQLGLF